MISSILLKSKESKNAIWLISGKIAQMLLSLIVGILTARYLGPSNYGLIGYGAAFVAFFTALCTLGINYVIIKDFVDHPEDQGLAVGSVIFLRGISSLCSAAMIVGISCVLDANEPLTIVVVALCSISLFFQIFDTLNFWFQSRYQSKVTAVVTFIAYFATSLYKIVLLVLQKDVRWFAFANSIDFIVLGALLLIMYYRYGGPKLKFSWKKGKYLLSKSYHYILSGMMVAIYGQTDRLMLKQMLDESSVGYYTIAATVSTMWVFILAAIIDSIVPTIMRLHKNDYCAFERKNCQLYSIVFYASMGVSLLITIFADFIIRLMYGEAFVPSASVLKIVTWYTAFSYLGVARNAWIVCENNQKYLKYMYFGAAVLNVLMNYFMIPVWGAEGAAMASLLTQIATSIVLPCFFKPMRRNVILMLKAITFKFG